GPLRPHGPGRGSLDDLPRDRAGPRARGRVGPREEEARGLRRSASRMTRRTAGAQQGPSRPVGTSRSGARPPAFNKGPPMNTLHQRSASRRSLYRLVALSGAAAAAAGLLSPCAADVVTTQDG